MKKWEKRKITSKPLEAKSSPLPIDYLRLVERTMTEALEKGLTELKKIHPVSEFYSGGAIFGDEVLVAITLAHGEANVAATTVYASSDYNPLSDKPGLETTLSQCVDAIGVIFNHYLDTTHPERIAQIANQSLGAMEDAPFDWTTTGVATKGVWVKMDKSNPRLEAAAEEWLEKNDPEYQSRLLEAESMELEESAEFLQERIEAIKKAKSGSGGGPIRH